MMSSKARVIKLFKYPVKSFTPESAQSLQIADDGRALGDRVLAFRFDNSGEAMRETPHGGWWYKAHLVSLMHLPDIARLDLIFDNDTRYLTISKDDTVLVRDSIQTDEGRLNIETQLEGFLRDLPEDLRPTDEQFPIHIEGDGIGGRFHDRPTGQLSLHSLASLNALAGALGTQSLDESRFRSNIVIDGVEPWEELELIGKRISIGDLDFEVTGPVIRCLAVHANPATGVRDQQILTTLTRKLGQEEPTFGILLQPVQKGGLLKLHDNLVVRS
jgi:hypothetical protein